MLEGYVQRYNNESDEKDVQIVAFDQNMLDLTEFSPKDSGGKEVRPREANTSDLLRPDMTRAEIRRNYPRLRAELHDRLATPLYPLVFAFVAIAFLGHARTTRENRWRQILAAFGIAVGLRATGIAVGHMVALSPWAILLVYGLPLGAIIVAAWAAHAKMVPKLRSKLSFGAKFKPTKIKFWTGRGMHAT